MANTEKKMTKAVAFEMAIKALENSAIPDAPEAIAKISKEIENLAKKKSGSGKPTAKQTANIGLGEMVVAHMAANPNQLFTVTDLMKSGPGLPAEITNQKLTALFRLDNVKPYIVRTMDKGKAFYQYKSANADEYEDEE